MMVVTGATGTVGSQVVKQLVAAGHSPRAVVRNVEKAKQKLGVGVECVPGDLGDVASLDRAFAGATKLFLLSGGPDLVKFEANALAAAKKAGVSHIVYLSVLGAQNEVGELATWHRATEKSIEASGLSYTFLRPTSFMSNTLHWVPSLKAQGKAFQATGDGKVSAIDPRDIAAVAVAALTKPGHEGKRYDLTGPVALSGPEQIAVLSLVTGKSFQFVDISDEAARDGMLKAGMPPALVAGLIRYYGAIRAGHSAAVSPDFEKAMGRKPGTFENWAKDHAALFA